MTSETVHPVPSGNGVPARVILVMGPSGSGRTTAIAALEDFGYETIHNLPISLIPRLLDRPLDRPLALSLDLRNHDFSAAGALETIDKLSRDPSIRFELLYLDTQPDVLIRRYSETRRRHPLAPADAPLEGILLETDLLAPIRARADILVDTSAMTPHDLRSEIRHWFDTGAVVRLAVSVHSFSYKRGVPRGLDMMFDCRFLTNPYWVPALRSLTGQDPQVADFISADPRYSEFLTRVTGLLLFLLPAHVAEGKSHLSIGFGCTGGQHRSVAVSEAVARSLMEAGWHVSRRHRELERRGLARSETAIGSGA